MPVTTITANVTYQDGVRVIGKPVLKHGDPGPSGYTCKAYQLQPLLELVETGKPVAISGRTIGMLDDLGNPQKALGRVSVISEDQEIVYDTFVSYSAWMEAKIDFTKSGVQYADIQAENGAQPVAKVVETIQQIIRTSGVVVCYGISKVRSALHMINFDGVEPRDIGLHPGYRKLSKDRFPELPQLSKVYLERPLSTKCTSSVVIAKTVMRLYQVEKKAIEAGQSGRLQWFPPPPPVTHVAPTEESSSGVAPSNELDRSADLSSLQGSGQAYGSSTVPSSNYASNVLERFRKGFERSTGA